VTLVAFPARRNSVVQNARGLHAVDADGSALFTGQPQLGTEDGLLVRHGDAMAAQEAAFTASGSELLIP